MPILDNTQMMRQIIIDHYQNPRNKRTPTDLDNYHKIHMNSTSCADDFWFYLKANQQNIITDVAFDGVGCTISTASSSIMSELLIGITLQQARYIIEQYHHMIAGEDFNDEVLDDAVVFINTARQPARIKCATISYDGIKQLIEEIERKEKNHD
ncbi:MAG: SUF system NifU family Fe-S cluster assembly protein [Bacilli bacterium]|jgi:nitrogen fixation NifU-like protein|nr:SUF system NifU family Fe-S cluster assembly protein [Bacilli bacterium]MDD3389149.1 SUF system NifU family Fe-S cluster assembly protein [Bacilli bacterium]MDD4344793.1 SUF system NifU family Fe-S cluster assembly protein [Bacilli bacterium]MDD4520883.1 SUF system NifU family Fe-S cluster assembly protein [Bacilli bacterium]MDY0399600.1 SUF system NifU family Fe-S cluster assembly protein [Bacilli bacterium]